MQISEGALRPLSREGDPLVKEKARKQIVKKVKDKIALCHTIPRWMSFLCSGPPVGPLELYYYFYLIVISHHGEHLNSMTYLLTY